MQKYLTISGYIVAFGLLACVFELRGYVSAGHTPVAVKPSPGDPEQPTSPLSLCNGKELIEQSDEKCALLMFAVSVRVLASSSAWG